MIPEGYLICWSPWFAISPLLLWPTPFRNCCSVSNSSQIIIRRRHLHKNNAFIFHYTILSILWNQSHTYYYLLSAWSWQRLLSKNLFRVETPGQTFLFFTRLSIIAINENCFGLATNVDIHKLSAECDKISKMQRGVSRGFYQVRGRRFGHNWFRRFHFQSSEEITAGALDRKVLLFFPPFMSWLEAV